MSFDSDRTVDNSYTRPNMRMTPLPNPGVTDNNFAFLVQRANVPNNFKGVIDSYLELGDIALRPYIDRPYLSNSGNISVKNGDRVLIKGNGNIQLWAATEGQWFTISDIGNKLKTLTPSVLRAPGYTFEAKAEDLELNSVGSAWGGGANDENTLLFVCDANKNWIIGGQMKLSDLFPQPTTPVTPGTPATTTDTTPPRIVLLDEPTANITNGNLVINIRALLTDEGTSSISGTPLPATSFVSRTPSSVTTVGEEPVKVQLRIEDVAAASPPIMTFVSRTPSSVTTVGEEPINLKVRISE
jgi:hypothetical protein